MSDLYTPPRASVDDRQVERPAWGNGAVALVSCLLVLGGLMAALFEFGNLRQANWPRIAIFIAAPTLAVAVLALRLPRVRWYWVAVCAPVSGLILGIALLWGINRLGLLDQ
jgi:hypothetical protein